MAHKRFLKQAYTFLALVFVIALSLAACSNPSGPDLTAESLTEKYTGSQGTKAYELIITQSAANAQAKAVAKAAARAAFTPAEGDSYVLKITENGVTQTSSGTVKAFSNNKFTLIASINVAVSFEVTVNSGGITNITGTITVQDGATVTAPGSLTSTGGGGGGGGSGGTGGGGSGGGGTNSSIPTFTDIEAFRVWLDDQPDNTTNNPYSVILNLSSLTDIGTVSLWGSNKYVNLDFSGSTFTSIPDGAFCDCTSLTDIELPDSVTDIGKSAFQGCTNLNLTELPSGITSIGDAAFHGCNNLNLIELPSGLISISDYAFHGCMNLSLTKLPSGITSIGIDSFSYCTNLSLTELPAGLTSIGDYAFASCLNINCIILPARLISIGDLAFYHSGIIEVICNATTPPSLGESMVFYNPYNLNPDYTVKLVIKVPSASVDVYKAASGWKNYAARIQAITP